jgi:uncharacterized membrane protein
VPDPKYGKIAKQRSLHNNYLTLPVIFFMLSSHYPLAFATQWNWIIASLIFLVGVVIRHYFNTRHARKGNPHWTWLAAIVLFIIIAWLSSGPKLAGSAGDTIASQAATPFMNATLFAKASMTVQTRCSMCHTAEPVWEGIYEAPKNVILDSDIAVANHAKDIVLQAGYTHAMPPGNVSEMTTEERHLLTEWYREGSAL